VDLCAFRPRRSAVPFRTQIAPGRILGNDQRDLPDSQPAFDLFFARDRIADVFKALSIDQAVEFVLFAKFRTDPPFVLPSASDQIVGNTRLEGLGPVTHDVNGE
jgi:hypothetical protein